MHFSSIGVLLSLGLFLTGLTSARTWVNKDGKEIEAEFIAYDDGEGTVTIKKGAKEYILSVDTISENDQKWIAEHVSALKHEKDKQMEPKGASDEIFVLLNKSPEDVATALKTLKMVEDIKSLKVDKLKKVADGSLGVQHSYDSGKVKFAYFEDKLDTIELFLMDGYTGAMPLGLTKSFGQNEATEILKKQDFRMIDSGRSPPGWGRAHSLISSRSKVVSVMTLRSDSPELAVIRIMQK